MDQRTTSVNQPSDAAESPSSQPKLLDLVRQRTCACRLAPSVGEAYVLWTRRFILFHNKRHPRELGSADVAKFLTHLSEQEHVPSPECSQARAAISFLYREVLHISLHSNAGSRPAAPLPSSRPADTDPTGARGTTGGPAPPKLLDLVRQTIRARHYSRRTEKAYANWIRRYVLFHDKRHPREMGTLEINQFLTHLAVQENVSASTQNQALHAVLFLYKSVLQIDIGLIEGVVRAKRPERLPVVLMRSGANIPTPTGPGRGNTSFPRRHMTPIVRPVSSIAITCTKVSFKRPSRGPPGTRASPNTRRPTPCVIRSPRICWKTGTTSARSKSCWATATFAPR